MTLEARRNSNDRLIAGAEVLGAGRTLGLSDDETIALKQRKIQERARRHRAEKAQRAGNEAAARAFLAQEDATFQQKAQADLRELGLGDRAREIDDQAWAFGEDPEYDMYAPDGRDESGKKYRQKSADARMRPQDDGQTYNATERAYMGIELDPDDINDPDVARQSGRYVKVKGKTMWEEGGRLYKSPKDVKGRIDNANPRQREPGGKEQGFRAMRDAVNRLNEGGEQFGFAAFGADGPEMERISREVGRRADEASALKADREQAQKEVIRDARIRRGDLTQEEMNMAVAQAVRAGRPFLFEPSKGKYVPEQVGGEGERKYITTSNTFDRDVEIASRVSAELEARKRDGQGVGPLRRALQVEDRAARAADEELIGRGPNYVRMRDRDLGRLVEIEPEQFGGLGKASHDPRISMDFVEVRQDNPSSFGFATPLMRDGKPIAYYDENMVELGNVNFSSSANDLNAPTLSPAQDWALKYQPAFGREGGTSFGYPQVGINEELALLGDRIRALKGYGFEGISNPRNIAEVEQALGAVVARSKKLGKNFYRPTPEGKNIKVDQPNMNDVLYALGYAQDFNGEPAADKQRLANALIQIQSANQSPVNLGMKDAYAARAAQPVRTGFDESQSLELGTSITPARNDVVFDVAEMRPDQGVPIARIPRGAKVGGKSVVAQLRALNEDKLLGILDQNGLLYGPDGKITAEAAQIIVNARDARGDAQQPFMGALAGDDVERARFIRGKDRGKGEAALVNQYGARGLAGAEIERRYEEDRRARIASLERRAQPPARQFLDEQFSAEASQKARRIEALREGNELAQLAMLVQDGAKYDGGPNFVAGGEFGAKAEPRPRGRNLVLPQESELTRLANPIAQEATRRKSGGGTIEYETPGRPADMPAPYTPPVVDGNGAPMPKPLYSSGPNPRQIQAAPVARSIAPDPGVPTGNQAAPMADAGGGGMKPPTRTAVSGGPMPDDMRDQLFDVIEGPYSDRPRSSEYMTSPDYPKRPPAAFAEGPESQASAYGRRVGRAARSQGQEWKENIEAFRTQPRYKTGRRALYGGAGLAGLATVLNLTNDDEEEQV